MYINFKIRSFASALMILGLTACTGESSDSTGLLPTNPDPIGDIIIDPADTTAPTVPAALTAADISSEQITLSWSAADDNVGVTGYKLYRNGSTTSLTTTTALTFSDTNVLPETQYSYRVSAIDAAGNESAQSLAVTAETLAVIIPGDTTAPTVPNNLHATSISSDQIALAWSAATDNVAVTGYRIYKNGSATPISTTSSLNFTDTQLAPETSYLYSISAIDAAGNESAMSAALVVNTVAEPDTTAPSTPANLHATDITSTQALLAWSAATDNIAVTGYRIYKNGSTTAVSTTSSLSFTDTQLAPETSYLYTVSAIDAAGNESAMSAALTINTLAEADTTSPSTPANLQATDISSTQVSLAWSAATDDVAVTGYRIYKDGSTTALTTTTSLSFVDTGILPETTYSYTVSAIDAAGNESSLSAGITVTTPAASTPQSITLTWISPTQNTDGSCIDSIQGYSINYGSESGSYTTTLTTDLNEGLISCSQSDFDNSCSTAIMTCSYSTEPLTQGTWYFAVQTYDASNIFSDLSNEVSKQVN